MTAYQLMDKGKIIAKEMKERILNGKVIADTIYKVDGCRILVTQTEKGKYGYAVFYEGKEEPFYIVEADYLLTDLQKKTAYDDHALIYPGAKSMIEKNLYGLYIEYFCDQWHEYLDFSVRAPKTTDVDIKPRAVIIGNENQYPTTILSIDYKAGKVQLASGADTYWDPKAQKQTISLGCVPLNSDGSPALEKFIEDEKHEQKNRKFLGLPYLRDRDIPNYILEITKQAQSLLLPIYQSLGIPVLESVEYCPLLSDALEGKPIDKYIDSDGKILNTPNISGHRLN